MAAGWAKGGGGARVVYVEIEYGRRPLIEHRASGPSEVAPGLWVVRLPKVPLVPRSTPDLARRLHLALGRPVVRRAMAGLGLTRPIAIYYGWFWAEWMGTLGESWRVYDVIDEHRAYPHVEARPRFARHVWRHERRMLARTDLLVALNPVLLEDRAPVAPGPARYLPNAIDPDRCRAAPGTARPASLADLPGPIALFLGVLKATIDVESLIDLAARRPDLSVVLVGIKNRDFELDAGSFPPNLRWVGPVDRSDLPAYLAAAEVGLLPFRPGGFTRGFYPIKLLEYLAAGLAVAGRTIPGAEVWAAEFPSAVRIADDLVEAVDRARLLAARHPRAGRQALVADRTWPARAARVVAWCRELGTAGR